jgi:putative transposase
MPWRTSSVIEQRARFVVLARKRAVGFASLCQQFGISRKTGYKWLTRHHEGGLKGLADRSQKPRQAFCRKALQWQAKALALRRSARSWGAKKIRARLGELYGRRALPSVRTIGRWLKTQGLVRVWQRTRRGPAVPHPGLTVPRQQHQVWTVDFKGWYRTGDGQRQEPLTVRELHSRYLLAIRLLPNQSEAAARTTFRRIFGEHGLPGAIRVDNGAPFGGSGALGLTRLSVWWRRLGIRVEFMRPARPGDNAGHEQMHGVYAREVATDAAADRAKEQRRVDRWREQYNHQRPHEALGLRPPGAFYRCSRRVHPASLPEWVYASSWSVRRVRAHGDIKWEGRLRFIGRAFVGEKVGLKLLAVGKWAVYLGKLLIGELYAADAASMRPAQWQRWPKAKS